MKRFEKGMGEVMNTKRIPAAAALALVAGMGVGHADNAAVLVEADKDTVTKFIYVGSSPNNATKPAVVVEGKALGIKAVANASYGATAVIGQVAGHSLPAVGLDRAGVLGAGTYGVMGKGNSFGVHGEGVVGVYGLTTANSSAGVKGVSSNGSSAGVLGLGGYGTAGVIGLSNNVGVSGEADYVGVEGIANGYGGWGVYGYTTGSPGFAGYFDGDVYATGIYDGSDLMLKEDVKPINKGLETVLALAPKTYRMKNGVTRAVHSDRQEHGLIAQDLETVLPELVRNVKSARILDGEGKVKSGSEVEFKAVNYSGLIPILIKAIQEQQARIEALEAERR